MTMPVWNHDETDVQAALQRETFDGAGDIPDGNGDHEDGDQ